MKKAFLLSPLIAALVFAVPEAWQQIREPGPGYVPVLNDCCWCSLAISRRQSPMQQ
jgi:hypothetical protein